MPANMTPEEIAQYEEETGQKYIPSHIRIGMAPAPAPGSGEAIAAAMPSGQELTDVALSQGGGGSSVPETINSFADQTPVSGMPPTAEELSAAQAMSMPPPAAAVPLPKLAGTSQEFKQFAEDTANAKKGLENHKSAILAESENQRVLQEEAQKRNVDEQRFILEQAQLAKDAQMRAVANAERMQNAATAVQEKARQAAADPIDPNRYWNNKSIGQKAAAVIAGALFGYTGQGMQWLNRLDALVSEDMRAQASDRESRVRGLEAQAAGLGRAGQEALQNGATLAEAHKIEQLARVQGLQRTLELYSQNLNSSVQRQRAAEMAAGMDQKAVALQGQLAELAQAKTNQENQNALHMYQSQLRAQGAGGAMGGKPLDSGQEEDISQLLSAKDTVIDAIERYKEMAGGAGSSVKGLLPTGVSDAASWDKNIRMQMARRIGKTLEPRMTDSDAIAYGEHFLPKSTSSKTEATQILDPLIVDTAQKYKNRYNSMKASGRDVRNFPSPEQFENELRLKTFESSSKVKKK